MQTAGAVARVRRGTGAALLPGMSPPVRVLLVMLLLTVSSSATTYVRHPSRSPASAAAVSLEVSGRVRSVRAERAGRRILTRVTVDLDVAGSDGETTTEILTPGGSIDGVRMWVSGAPEFAVGEHVRVKVRATRSGLHLADLADGKVLLP